MIQPSQMHFVPGRKRTGYFFRFLHILCTWLRCQETLNLVHKAQRVVVRKKRAKAMVLQLQKNWVKQGKLSRLRKLRVVRQTRFCSNCQTLDSFLLNATMMRHILPTEQFKSAMRASTAEKNQKVENALKAWQSNSVYERARRALKILGPTAILCRQAAHRDFFQCLPAWLRARKTIAEAVGAEDFADARHRESGLLVGSSSVFWEGSVVLELTDAFLDPEKTHQSFWLWEAFACEKTFCATTFCFQPCSRVPTR